MPLLLRWALSGLLVAGFGLLSAAASYRFGYDYEVAEMPVIWLTAGLVLAGLLYCLGLPRLLASSLAGKGVRPQPIVLCIIAGGLVARLALFASEPMLEDDYQRYLWDGAVTATGHNPYVQAPRDAGTGGLGELAQEAGQVFARINHADLKTIYPPVAQGAFALAYMVRPWSLTAWRSVLLLFDLASLALILLLLREAGRSPLWSSLYWWNPLVIKELFNSAHMEAVVLPFVLAALWLAIRNRHVLAATSLAFAAGAKVWPGLLLPLLLRAQSLDPGRLLASILVFGALAAFWVAPVWLGGLDQASGFVVYLSEWQTNSALFPLLVSTIGLALPPEAAGIAARCLIALLLAVLAMAVSLKPVESPDDLIGRASLVVAALILLSPAQFPWYAVWFAPFLPFRPWFGFLLLTATAPLYYLSFYFLSQNEIEIFDDLVVWIIWVPVWAALALEARRATLSPQAA